MSKFAWFLVIFWTAFILVMGYLYLFEPELFHKMMGYPGAGSPYVNTPQR